MYNNVTIRNQISPGSNSTLGVPSYRISAHGVMGKGSGIQNMPDVRVLTPPSQISMKQIKPERQNIRKAELW